MANIIDIGELNPMKFYELDPDENSIYNWKHFDRYWFEEQILSFQQQVIWSQPWQVDDVIKLQFSANFAPIQIDFLDCQGKVVPGMSFNAGVIVTSYVEPGFQKSQVEMSLDPLSEGYYYLLLTVGSGGSLKKFISERIHVLEVHENSILLQYKHGRNISDIAFDTGIEFNLRVPAVLQDFSPGSDDVIYKDQSRNITTLSSVPYRNFKMIFGDARGIPDYMADKINRVFGCNSVLLDNKRFAKSEGAKMERSGDRLYPMAGWVLEIVEALNRMSTRFSSTGEGQDELTVAYDIETKMFGAFNAPASSNVVRVYKIE
ncbi:MAG TPA: hypothetical protein VF487_20280 [Chitinophagaceae bacterium]